MFRKLHISLPQQKKKKKSDYNMMSNWKTLGWSKNLTEKVIWSRESSKGVVLDEIKSNQTPSKSFSYGKIENGLSATECRKKYVMGNLRLGKKRKTGGTKQIHGEWERRNVQKELVTLWDLLILLGRQCKWQAMLTAVYFLAEFNR